MGTSTNTGNLGSQIVNLIAWERGITDNWSIQSSSEELLDESGRLDLGWCYCWKLGPGFTRIIADKVCFLVGACFVFLLWDFWWGFEVWFWSVILLLLFFSFLIAIFVCCFFLLLLLGLFLLLFLFITIPVLHLSDVVILFSSKHFPPESNM